MELTIIEKDPLNSRGYNTYIPAVTVSKNKQNINLIVLIGAIILGLVILFLILERYAENNQ